MPVGLNLVETVEQKLADRGLLSFDRAELHRIIDFARGDFCLRWSVAEAGGATINLRLTQQLAQRSLGQPMLKWRVSLEDVENATIDGRCLLSTSLRSDDLAADVADACEQILQSQSGRSAGAERDHSIEEPDPEL